MQIAILAFDDVEALDLAGPYEVFTTAARMAQRLATEAGQPLAADSPAHWQVLCVAETLRPVRARAGMTLLPSHDFSQCPRPDLLLVPGGVVDAPSRSPATLAWVQQAHEHAKLTASVCTGAFILAAAGVLHDQPVTTHWEDVADLRQQHPSLKVQEGVRWVDQGRLITSAGISAGIDMSLHLVQRLGGQALAERTARQMDYRWLKNPA
ncbi:DJ-1/PfpI family protein [Curvibacter sp. RS43]|uniref:DJ-1/PfpI family protein n=1 Tax=Curvibacter microcysteis TaxID=3026419 RepID=UPI00235EE64A|nr:DJ-1/PfpI family protein [Curvibacter sp. RS43]MDD0811941.1 DJ-1/PfpI family protein [Curvibacter sp. RS43]